MINQAQTVKLVADSSSSASNEAALHVEITDFQDAAEPINQLLATLKRLDLIGSHQRLLTLVTQQAHGLLQAVDALLMQSRLYTVKAGNFSWWNGEASLAFIAFGVRDDEVLAAYLAAQQQRVSGLSTTYAAPLVGFLEQYSVSQDQEQANRLTKWRDIQSALDGYAQKTPENSVALLEQFILELNTVTPTNCLKENGQPLTFPGDDYFLQQREALRRELIEQCQGLTQQMAMARYQKLEALFTDTLAGRFPFVGGKSGTVQTEATPDDIRSFYRVFDASAPLIQAALEERNAFENAEAEVHAFLQQMQAIRTFMASFIDGVGGIRIPTFDVQVTFRAHTKADRGDDEIIDWRLQVGDTSLRYRGPRSKAQGRWTFGTPVTLSLRWAKDARSIPISDAAGREGVVRGRTITYTDATGWSLLRFLQRHAGLPSDFDRLVDPEPSTLSFTITTGSTNEQDTSQEGSPANTSQAKVFVRLIVMSADRQEPLTIPPFPAQAPSWVSS